MSAATDIREIMPRFVGSHRQHAPTSCGSGSALLGALGEEGVVVIDSEGQPRQGAVRLPVARALHAGAARAAAAGRLLRRRARKLRAVVAGLAGRAPRGGERAVATVGEAAANGAPLGREPHVRCTPLGRRGVGSWRAVLRSRNSNAASFNTDRPTALLGLRAEKHKELSRRMRSDYLRRLGGGESSRFVHTCRCPRPWKSPPCKPQPELPCNL